MGGPIASRMVPGRLMKHRRRQKSPELWAIGTTARPVRLARNAPPRGTQGAPRREPGPFREHHHPQAVVEAAAALANERPRRLVSRGAVDGDGAEQREAPAEEGHAQQGSLEQPGLRGEEGLKGEGLPHRLVAAEHDGRLPREVPGALHDEAKPARGAEPPEVEPAPAGDEAVTDAVRERRGQGSEEGEHDG